MKKKKLKRNKTKYPKYSEGLFNNGFADGYSGGASDDNSSNIAQHSATNAAPNGNFKGTMKGVAAAGTVISGIDVDETDVTASTLKGVGTGAASGAALGASVGGPWGAAIGGVVGGVAGGVTAAADAKDAVVMEEMALNNERNQRMRSQYSQEQAGKQQSIQAFRKGGRVMYSNGGVNSGQNAFVDHNEVLMNPNTGDIDTAKGNPNQIDGIAASLEPGTSILSDEMEFLPGKSYAKQASKFEKIQKDADIVINNDKSTKLAKKTAELNKANTQKEFEKLLNIQEDVKIKKQLKKRGFNSSEEYMNNMVPSFNSGGTMPKERKGVRPNKEGGYSTHIMEYGSSDNGFVAYPTLFQNEDGSWLELSSDSAFKEAKKRGEIYNFEDEQSAKDFAGGSWKKDYDNNYGTNFSKSDSIPSFNKGGVFPKYINGTPSSEDSTNIEQYRAENPYNQESAARHLSENLTKDNFNQYLSETDGGTINGRPTDNSWENVQKLINNPGKYNASESTEAGAFNTIQNLYKGVNVYRGANDGGVSNDTTVKTKSGKFEDDMSASGANDLSKDVKTKQPATGGDIAGLEYYGGNKMVDYLPAMYDISTGLFGKADRLDQSQYTMNNRINPFTYNERPEIEQNRKNSVISRYNNARTNTNTGADMSFGIASNIARQRADSQVYGKKFNIDNQSKMAADQMNMKADQFNAQSKFKTKMTNMANEAKKRDFLAKGLEQVAQGNQRDRLERNKFNQDKFGYGVWSEAAKVSAGQKELENINNSFLESQGFTKNSNGKVIKKKRKS